MLYLQVKKTDVRTKKKCSIVSATGELNVETVSRGCIVTRLYI